jgi:hypothetical protein
VPTIGNQQKILDYSAVLAVFLNTPMEEKTSWGIPPQLLGIFGTLC